MSLLFISLMHAFLLIFALILASLIPRLIIFLSPAPWYLSTFSPSRVIIAAAKAFVWHILFHHGLSLQIIVNRSKAWEDVLGCDSYCFWAWWGLWVNFPYSETVSIEARPRAGSWNASQYVVDPRGVHQSGHMKMRNRHGQVVPLDLRKMVSTVQLEHPRALCVPDAYCISWEAHGAPISCL